MNYLTDIYSFAILIGVAGAVIAFSIGVYYFVQDKRLMQMKAWASIVVNSLEQSMKLVSGPRKFELAMLALRGIRDRVGAKATDQELSMLIEGAVHVMKNLAAATPGSLDDELVGSLTDGLDKSL